jgi:hypothetical protein
LAALRNGTFISDSRAEAERIEHFRMPCPASAGKTAIIVPAQMPSAMQRELHSENDSYFCGLKSADITPVSSW